MSDSATRSLGTTCVLCDTTGNPQRARGLDLLMCPSCGFVWMSQVLLSDTYYEDLEHVEKTEGRMRNAQERIRTLAPHVALDHLLDVGTGDGMFLHTLRAEGYSGGIGIEPSALGRAAATAYGEKVLTGGYELVPQAVAENGSTAISLFHVIEHVTNPREVLTIFFNSLPKGGSLIIETPDTSSYIFRSTNLEFELVYPEHVMLYNAKNLKKLLEEVGFTVTAHGRRSYDERHMSIRQSLIRLGFVKYVLPKKILPVDGGESEDAGSSAKKYVKEEGGHALVRNIVRNALSTVVRILQRGDYVWMVAKKS